MSVLGRIDARGDVTGLVVGSALTVAVALAATRYGAALGLGALVALTLFVAATACFLVAPHVAVALTIPFFASIPAIKVLAAHWVGPAKDGITLAAALATALYVLQRDGARGLERTDRLVLGAVAGLVVLYVLNVGGLSADSWHGPGWLHGVRLMLEPILLLLAGLLLPHAQRTMRWAAASIIATGCVVAAYGLLQQALGIGALGGLGYTYGQQLETIGSQLRSFGTLDDSFAYAAFLFLALVPVIFWLRGVLSWICGGLIAAGIAVSFVQTAVVVASALLALWLVRSGRTAPGIALFLATLGTGLTLAIAAAPATESKTVQAGPSTYLTLNGRTDAWATIFDDEHTVFLGQGVGAVGRASMRARIGITDVSGGPNQSREGEIAVDSGYLAVVADVGVAGLALLVLLIGRMLALARWGTKLPGAGAAGWLCLGYLTVLLLDALTRDSFTGFPTAYLAFLLVGISLAVIRDEGRVAHPPAAFGR